MANNYNSDLDKILWKIDSQSDKGLTAVIYSYNGGEPKLGLHRVYNNNLQNAGRLITEDLNWIMANIEIFKNGLAHFKLNQSQPQPQSTPSVTNQNAVNSTVNFQSPFGNTSNNNTDIPF